MKSFIVILGVVALLAFTHAQSEENENISDQTFEEDNKGSSESRPIPPESPEHPDKPQSPESPERPESPEKPEHPLRPPHHRPPGHGHHETKPEPDSEEGRKILPGVYVVPNGLSFRGPGISIDIARPNIFQQKPKQEQESGESEENAESQSFFSRLVPHWG